jgi:hypothetical protein
MRAASATEARAALSPGQPLLVAMCPPPETGLPGSGDCAASDEAIALAKCLQDMVLEAEAGAAKAATACGELESQRAHTVLEMSQAGAELEAAKGHAERQLSQARARLVRETEG